jgi:hypothetical protein
LGVADKLAAAILTVVEAVAAEAKPVFAAARLHAATMA